MGQLHFEQMYEDAVRVDCRAFMNASRMKYEWDPHHPDDTPIMSSVPFSRVMVTSRRLLGSWDTCVARLQELHASGVFQIRLFSPSLGHRVVVENVRVLEDEYNTLTPDLLFAAMMQKHLEDQ